MFLLRSRSNEKNGMEEIKKQLNDIWHQEETKAWQRSRDKHILEGDRNTSYFHAIANQRRKKEKVGCPTWSSS
jgi:hypothetical protein